MRGRHLKVRDEVRAEVVPRFRTWFQRLNDTRPQNKYIVDEESEGYFVTWWNMPHDRPRGVRYGPYDTYEAAKDQGVGCLLGVANHMGWS